MLSCRTLILVTDPPGKVKIEGPDREIGGNDLTLSCQVHGEGNDLGNPTGTYYWIRPNGKTGTGSQLTILNSTMEEDSGTYTCYLGNEYFNGTSDTHNVTILGKN